MTMAVEQAEGARVEFRCPESTVDGHGVPHPGPLFAVLLLSEARKQAAGDLIEIACQRCKQRRNRNGERLLRVVHRFAITGDLVETLAVPEPQV